jgi:spore maturation protein CgeB
VYGPYKPYYKNLISWLFREKRSVFKNVHIPPEKVNELFSRSKIALNIHHEQTTDGANQRVFESSGAGAYQVCDANPFIESLFPNSEAGLYHNDEELFACIDDALNNDKSENARRAQQIVLSGHTFKHRIEEILNKIDFN